MFLRVRVRVGGSSEGSSLDMMSAYSLSCSKGGMGRVAWLKVSLIKGQPLVVDSSSLSSLQLH